MRNALYDETRTAIITTTPICIAIAILAPILVPLAFGAKYSASVPIVQVLMSVTFVYAISYYHTAAFLSIGRPDLRFRLLVIHTLVNLTGFYLAVMIWKSPLAVASA